MAPYQPTLQARAGEVEVAVNMVPRENMSKGRRASSNGLSSLGWQSGTGVEYLTCEAKHFPTDTGNFVKPKEGTLKFGFRK